MKNVISSWALFLGSMVLFVYDLANGTNIDRFHMYNLQIVEAVLLVTFVIITFESYRKIFTNVDLHMVSSLVIFILITTIKYELDSSLMMSIHSICYTYLFVILAIITNKNKDRILSLNN